jgi:hypothetical protein
LAAAASLSLAGDAGDHAAWESVQGVLAEPDHLGAARIDPGSLSSGVQDGVAVGVVLSAHTTTAVVRVAAELGDIAATRRSANLAAKVAADFYHYAPLLDRLDCIAAARAGRGQT